MDKEKKLNTKDLGNIGENIAIELLLSKDYSILERNWRFRKAEIDIICKKDNILVFVEVKSKSYKYFGEPEESISVYKENLIIDAASQYMVLNNYEWEIRFDIISILFEKNKTPLIHHYEDAFFPGL
ncbi:MAG: YraN family protein [Saprospiraceae bacterium]|nr:YraN family protein [Saprospiraceae bacterium]